LAASARKKAAKRLRGVADELGVTTPKAAKRAARQPARRPRRRVVPKP